MAAWQLVDGERKPWEKQRLLPLSLLLTLRLLLLMQLLTL